MQWHVDTSAFLIAILGAVLRGVFHLGVLVKSYKATEIKVNNHEKRIGGVEKRVDGHDHWLKRLDPEGSAAD